MEKENHYILFKNHTEGMKLEELLRENNIKYVISPTPRELSTCCGISVVYKKEDEEKIKGIVEKNSIDVMGFYTLKKKYTNFYA
ncbi:DUF3343 domain-containing protein [Clostridium sp. KNHs214]|uniref:DUF3343 domain-containing protein n=1 Tax=Clostridium sp. KNHs214 TaxID=1540257 RepID=UPI000550AB55|nr:DUF3343 domain-containing protein [Clostridium sp. KNHs214]